MTTTANASSPGSASPAPRPEDLSDSRPDGDAAADPIEASGPTIHTIRARKLLLAGLLGGVVAAVGSVIGFGLGYGTKGAVTALIAAVMVLFFYAAGQLVMVMFANSGARTLLLVSLVSYSTRVMVLGLVLLSYSANRRSWPSLEPTAMFVTTMACVVGWLVVEVLVFSRLRIGAYDTEYQTPRDSGSDGMSAQ